MKFLEAALVLYKFYTPPGEMEEEERCGIKGRMKIEKIKVYLSLPMPYASRSVVTEWNYTE